MPTPFLPLPSYQTVSQMLSYDPQSGSLTWRTRPNKPAFNVQRAGKKAGWIDGNGYLNVMINQVEYKAHRLIWLLQTGRDPGHMVIDHVDNDPKNQAWSNLRLASHSENSMNAKRSRRNSSGVKGVSFNKRNQKWRAYIRVNYDLIFLGDYTSLALAASARMCAARTYHGNFARHA